MFFFQIRDFVKKKLTTLLEDTEISGVEKLFFGTREVSLSMCYKTLKGYFKSDSSTLAQAWGGELNICITEEMWSRIWNSVRKITICNRSWALQLKLLHRAHLAPNQVSKFKPGSSSLCPKFKMQSHTLSLVMPQDPEILGIYSD